jgi:hypothetical protein
VIGLIEESEATSGVSCSSSPSYHANRLARRVRVPRIATRCDYFTALHEIGHVVLGESSDQSTLDIERAAWRWAIGQARVPQTQAVRAMIRRSLQSYEASDRV